MNCAEVSVGRWSVSGAENQKISTQERIFCSTAFQLVMCCFVICRNSEGVEMMIQILIHVAHLLEDDVPGSKSAILHM